MADQVEGGGKEGEDNLRLVSALSRWATIRSRTKVEVKVKVKVKGVKFATRPTTSGYSNTASSKMKQSEDIVALGPGLQSLVDTMKDDYNRLNLGQPSDDEVISPPAKIYRIIQYI